MLITRLVLIQVFCYCYGKEPKKWNETKSAAKYDNPNFVRDRLKFKGKELHLPESMIPAKPAFHPAWMDYCDPYHCNDYHKVTCGLNRKNLRFKWFQSECHLIYNNMCANHRGSLKYDIIDTKYCAQNVMDLRSRCPHSCNDEMAPVCGISAVNNQAVLFKNRCSLEMANCRERRRGSDEYEEVYMAVCDYYLRHNYSK